jgi:CxxC-x17-CxxC domain-containing protein
LKGFWENEFNVMSEQQRVEAISPILNKVGQYIASPTIRNIIGKPYSTIDLEQIMNEGKILIVNLSQGRLGEDNAALLGAMLITKFQLAAMNRINIPEDQRRDFFLYIDEFQNFATDSFANILSEARKYRLNLIMGHQYIEQLTEKVEAAVFGNVGTLVVFRVGAVDAEELVKEFLPTFTQEDLVNLPKYNFCLKLMIDGVASNPFSARGLPPLKEVEKTGNEEAVIEISRNYYAGNREAVEQAIATWHEDEIAAPDKPAAVSPASVATEPYDPHKVDRIPAAGGWEVNCDSCGQPTRVAFQPDGVRPVFCRQCLAKGKEERKQQMETRKQAKQTELANLAAVEKSGPELSLNDLSRATPVDFRGRNLKTDSSPDRHES